MTVYVGTIDAWVKSREKRKLRDIFDETPADPRKYDVFTKANIKVEYNDRW